MPENEYECDHGIDRRMRICPWCWKAEYGKEADASHRRGEERRSEAE